ESSVHTLRITATTIEFLDNQENQVQIEYAPELVEGDRMPLYIEDLHRLGDPVKELDQLDPVTLLQYYYQLGERMAVYNWNSYVREEMKDQFTSGKYRNALRTARRVYTLYNIRGVHNLLVTQHLSANILHAMNKANFNTLCEEAKKGLEKENEHLVNQNIMLAGARV
ncbi:27514_t:CDS:2, partial [Racocetra persica]